MHVIQCRINLLLRTRLDKINTEINWWNKICLYPFLLIFFSREFRILLTFSELCFIFLYILKCFILSFLSWILFNSMWDYLFWIAHVFSFFLFFVMVFLFCGRAGGGVKKTQISLSNYLFASISHEIIPFLTASGNLSLRPPSNNHSTG